MGVLDSILGVGSAIAGGISSAYSSKMNYEAQRETNSTNVAMNEANNRANQELTREGWARDDNAVQRRTADLKAAGLNPVLAAGSAATSGAPIPMHAAQVDAPQVRDPTGIQGGLAAAAAMADIQQKQASIAQTRAQAKLTNVQAENAAATSPMDIQAKQQQDQNILDTAQAVVRDANISANLKQTATALALVNLRLQSRLTGIDVTGFEKVLPEGMTLDMADPNSLAVAGPAAQKAYVEAETAVLAKAIVAGKLDASFLEKVGVSPMLIDTIMKIVGSVGSFVGGALR